MIAGRSIIGNSFDCVNSQKYAAAAHKTGISQWYKSSAVHQLTHR
jgi:hypothetical protein